MKKKNIVQLRVPHNHEPDAKTLKRLEARKILFEAAANSSPGALKKTFDAILEEFDAADSFGPYNSSVYRTLKRIQDENERKIFDKEYDYDDDTEEMTEGEDEQRK